MKEHILREVEAEYQAKRHANEDEEARRLTEASARDPKIGVLTQRRRTLFQQRMRDAFSNPEQAQAISTELAQAMRTIAEQLRQRLTAAGYPADYLQPVYSCAICKDHGYVGEPIREMCQCMRARVYALQSQTDNLGILFEECFEGWDAAIFDDSPLPEMPQGQRAYMERIRQLCERYADDFPDTPQRNLLFSGTSGLGKTYLLNCIGGRVLSRGYTAWKLTAHKLAGLLREEAFGRGDPQQHRLLVETPLLLIDDLGTEPMLENITMPQLFRLIDERMTARRHTVISTNLTPHELLERYTERICSRLMDARTTMNIRFIGKDVRRMGK